MFKVRETFIPFCIPDVSEREVDAVAGAIRSGWWAKGPLTVEFEKRFAQYVGAKHAIAVNSCTAALHLALLSQDIGPGDEVITSPLTFASTASTIVHTGATPTSTSAPAALTPSRSSAGSRSAPGPSCPCTTRASPATWTPCARCARRMGCS